ncbi:MAG: tetratricopeptide repeat protein [Paracoccaceae bacterium]
MKLTIKQALQQGVEAHKEGKLKEAESLYRAIIKLEPAQPDANHNLGVLALSVSKASEALPLFKTALEANPKVEQFWLSYIEALIKEIQFEQASEVLEQARKQGVADDKLDVFRVKITSINKKGSINPLIPSMINQRNLYEHFKKGRFIEAEQLAISITQEFPNHQFAWKVLGAVLKKTGQISESLIPMQKSAKLNPKDAEAHNNLGVTLKLLGLLGEAKESFTKAIDLKPNFAEAYYNLGNVLIVLKKLGEAETSFKKAISLKPAYAEAYNNLGLMIKELDRLSEAETSFKKAIDLKPDFAEAYFNLGVTQQELERLGEAETSFKKAISLKPDFAEAYFNLGVTQQELERLGEAEVSYTKAIDLKPNYAEALNNLGSMMQELKRLDEAERSFKKAIDLKPDFAEAYFNLGVTQQELGQLVKAEESYTKAINLKSDYAEAFNNLGVILQELSRLGEAEESFEQAINLKPKYTEAFYNLGNTLKELSRLDEAEKSYRQAIALKPDYAEAFNNLGVMFQELHRLSDAEKNYRQAIAFKPEYSSAKHMLAALTGETTTTAPRDYVEGLFDNYAVKFESALVESLEYQIPRLITEMIIKESNLDLLGSIMDLGCGTGLLGAEIKNFCAYLEGIDLSDKMLDKAREKDIYNKLIKDDIISFLSNKSLNFDYFISTDVFIYIGDLSNVFRLIKSRNKTAGKLAFSTEHYDGEGFFLEKSGRYSHSKNYIDSLCDKFGYKMRYFESLPLRKEREEFISGGLYLLDF